MNRKGKSTNWGVILLLALLLGGGYYMLDRAGVFEKGIATTTTTTTTAGSPSGLVSCPSDGQTDVYWRYRNGLSTTNSWLVSGTGYLMPVSGKTDGLVTLAATTASTTGTVSGATAVTCSKTTAGVYRPIVANLQADGYTTAGTASVDYGRDVTISDNSVYFRDSPPEVVGFPITGVHYRVHDEDSDAYMNCTSGTSFTPFVLNLSYPSNITGDSSTNDKCYYGTTGYTNRSISAAGQYYRLRIDLKASSANTKFGQDDLKTYMCADYTTSTWNEPIVSVGGVQKSDVKSQMQSYDLNMLSNVEKCYEIGTIDGNVQKSVNYYQEASADCAEGIRFSFYAEGRYKSSRSPDTIQAGIWSDASTQVPVVNNYNQHFLVTAS